MFLQMMMAAAVVAQAGGGEFDLNCAGTMKTHPLDGSAGVDAEYTSKIRISLARGLWCWDACETVSVIEEADAARIVLSDSRDDSGGSSYASVDRVTGSFFQSMKFREETMTLDMSISGECEPARYSGIPATKF